MSRSRFIGGSTARLQLFVALMLGVVFASVAAALDLMTHSQSLAQWVMRTDQRINRQDRGRYSYENYFIDFEDRLINQELPSADYSKGGVYLIGTSNLKWSTRLWELPENQRALIHNYGMGSFNHGYQFQFLRYLVDYRGLLAAGGEKNLVIFGVSYHCTGTVCDPGGFFPNLWTRHGLFTYSQQEGITPLPVDPRWRYVHFERVRIAGCLKKLLSTLVHQMGWHSALRIHNPALYNHERQEWMGPDWQEKMNSQVKEFGAMADYLLARHVRVAVVFMPQGSWESNLPFEGAYENMVTDVCRGKAIPVIRWPKLLDDDDFADSNHANLYGMDKLQPAFLEIALPFLHATGALPSP